MARLLELTTPQSLAGPEPLLQRFEGEEALSRPFLFQLGFWSANENITASDLIGKEVTVTLTTDSSVRYFNGIVRHLQAGDRNGRGSRYYQIEVVPYLRLLTERSNSRIFEQQSAVDIVKTILGEHGIQFTTSGIQGTHITRDYCVQYRETDFNFVSRLLEEEGIFYFFTHTQSGHTMVLGDGTPTYTDDQLSLAYFSGTTTGNAEVLSWDHDYDFIPQRWVQNDRNYLTPAASLLTNSPGKRNTGNYRTKFEMYDYPGLFAKEADGTRLTQYRMEEDEAVFDTVRAATICHDLAPGGIFALRHNIDGETGMSWVVVSAHHSIRDDVGINATDGSAAGTGYSNSIVAMPATVVYRPPRSTPKPYIHGHQTAIVTGPSGEEMYTDKYGRVQVQFFWDRENTSSCWIRVAHGIAGRNWGMQYLPRIGHEVIVSFLEGDPDRPLVIGSVYHAENMPPSTLPDNMTQSGYISRSTKTGAADNCNQFWFEDKKGSELVTLHAEKDFNREVEHDETVTVGNNQTITVTQDRTETVQKGNEAVTIQQGNRTVTVSQGNDTHEIDQGNRSVTISMGNDSLEIKMGNQTTKLSLGSSSTEAMQSIELKVGSNSITIDQTGITIKGMMVSIQGELQAELKSAMTQINGSAMVQIQGGVTMIG